MNCPACGHQNFSGVEHCESCFSSLVENPTKSEGFGRQILQDKISSLEPDSAITVQKNDCIEKVFSAMKAARKGCVAVLDGETLVGIFSERDALMRVAGKVDDISKTKIETVMTPNPEIVHMQDKISFAINRMSVGGYRHIPVLDGHDKQVVALVSARDILSFFEKYVNT